MLPADSTDITCEQQQQLLDNFELRVQLENTRSVLPCTAVPQHLPPAMCSRNSCCVRCSVVLEQCTCALCLLYQWLSQLMLRIAVASGAEQLYAQQQLEGYCCHSSSWEVAAAATAAPTSTKAHV